MVCVLALHKMLFCGPANVSVDNVALKCLTIFEGDDNRVVLKRLTPKEGERVNSILLEHHSYEKWCMDGSGYTGSNQKAKKERNAWGRENLADVFDVLASTLVLAGDERIRSVGRYASTVLTDEAGQPTEPECLVPLQYLVTEGRLILMGDSLQLKPMVKVWIFKSACLLICIGFQI